jgi:hypothetical protein
VINDREAAPMNINLTYTLTQSQVEAAIRANRRAVRTEHLLGISANLIIGIVLIAFGERCIGIGILALAALQTWGITAPVGLIAARWLRRLGQEIQVQLSDDGYDYAMPGEDSHRPWTRTRVVDVRDYLTLSTARKVLVVPCGEFTAEQRAQVSALLGSGRVRKVVRGRPAV